ncbi:MAG: acyl-ACP--UDP-N-acetylglucosamine O-acyltransferase [Candidatus Dadabacteria bacterium]|nr:MAG: acyl-ACP--UDP-N-acetylglucosamine O-acyltransferase [Candidatus Dadabacteria bacterium]
MPNIHPTAVVLEGAVIGEGTTVGPYSVIGHKVSIGRNNWISSHVVIDGNTKIGDGNKVFQFASIGAPPQDLKYKGEDSLLTIGNHNIIREYVTIQPGTEGGGMETKVGDRNLFMACSHIGHDCVVGDYNIFANSAGISGHVIIGNHVTVGGLCGVHQFVRLGDYCFLSGGAMVGKDVPPFCTAQGDRAGLAGLNTVGMKRNGFDLESINLIKRLYRELFLGDGLFRERLECAMEKYKEEDLALSFLRFISESKRGVCMPRSASSSDTGDNL